MRPTTVLVVDDAASVVDALRETLTDLGYQVDGAIEGAAALRLFIDKRHDVVLTDLRMPEISGWDLIAEIRRVAPIVPIIAMSGSLSDADRSRARQHTAHLVEKPVDFDDLELLIGRCTESRRVA